MKIKEAWKLTRAVISEFFEDRVLRLSAALAYYAIFSLGPLLFLVIYIASFVFGQQAVTGEVQRQLQDYIGPQAAKTVQSMMAARQLEGSLLTTVIGFATLLFGASGVFGQLQDSLNTIWEVQPRPSLGMWYFLRSRFLSLGMVIGLGFLLLISMVITTVLQALVHAGSQIIPLPGFVTQLIAITASFIVVTLLFAALFRILPDAIVKWRDALVGAFFTAVLFTIGKYLLGLYIGREGTSSAYGAAGSVIVILLWIYYSSLILFLGAEFTQVWSCRHGRRIEPAPYAEAVTELARAEQGIPRQAPVKSSPTPAPVTGSAAAKRAVPEGYTWATVAAVVSLGFLAGWLVKATNPQAAQGAK